MLLYAVRAMRLAAAALFCTSVLMAQTADTVFYRAVMLNTNEVPATTADASGVADILVHVVRDSSGQVTSGTVDFLIRVKSGIATNAVGLHIHSGNSTVSGPVVIGTNLSAGAPQALTAGSNVVHIPVQVDGSNTTALTALRGLLQTPDQYYVNIHTTEFPGGAVRGQLAKAVGRVLLGVMSSENEVPAPPVQATGMAVVVALAADDGTGKNVSGEVYISTTYNMEDRGTFTGFHIHPGLPGTTGPAVLGAALPAGLAIDSSGSGTVGPYPVEMDLTSASSVLTFTNLFTNPGADYINIHTSQHGGGVMRAQLRPADTMTFPVTMSSANETAKTTVNMTAPAVVTLHTIRNEDGSVAAGTVFFDVNYRFAGPTQITGLHIHDAPAGVNGSITIPLIPNVDPTFTSDTGFGNIFDWTPGILNLAVLEDITKNPENHYVNIHTSTDPGGVSRAQLAPAVTSVGTVAAAISANLDKTATTVAPGGLISIFGTNLAKVAVDLSGWQGRTLPSLLNGTRVTIGGKAAPILFVSGTQINAQVPVDVGTGPQAVVVNNGVAPSASFNVNVAAVAPAIFFAPSPAILKLPDFSLVSATNPVKSGDTVVVFATGMGQTTPALTTGGLVGSTISNTSTVTATVGGQNATVISSVASPGFAGLYQVAVTIPSGVSGSVPVVLTQAGTKSNSVNIPVQ
jgi:uncharacterized protein (TIGR03437 family)